MNPVVRKLWGGALRSRRYPQGTGRLCRRADGLVAWCCLGVLCDLADQAGVISHRDDPDGLGDVVFDGETGFLPDSVMAWAGLDLRNPLVTVDGYQEPLADLNDGGAPFARIADLIDGGEPS